MDEQDRENIKTAIKQASRGLIGDKVKLMDAERFHQRVIFQCKRLGVIIPAWSFYIDLCRELGYTFEQKTVFDVCFNSKLKG